MFKGLKRFLGRGLINTLGWHTNRKIIVIESDDWGSIRMPSIEILTKLIQNEVKFDLNLGYDRNDTIASQSDIEHLFEILSSVKDRNNNPAFITANCIVANPDFGKIKASNFSTYHYELITETMSRYYSQSNPFVLWKQGLDSGLFYPQFHGREHLNVQLWLKLLQDNISGSRDAFEETVFSQSVKIPDDNRVHVLSAYDYHDESEQSFIYQSIKEGLNIFEKLFGFRSISAVAPCYVWDDFVEKCYFDEGIRYIQGGTFQNYSTYQKKQLNKNGQYNYCGKKNKYGQYYIVRNCFFEPTFNPNMDCVDECLKRINFAFRWNKPAVISTHRLNYTGTLNKKNRDVNLKNIDRLLKNIIKQWSEVEFFTSDKLGDLIREKYERVS